MCVCRVCNGVGSSGEFGLRRYSANGGLYHQTEDDSAQPLPADAADAAGRGSPREVPSPCLFAFNGAVRRGSATSVFSMFRPNAVVPARVARRSLKLFQRSGPDARAK